MPRYAVDVRRSQTIEESATVEFDAAEDLVAQECADTGEVDRLAFTGGTGWVRWISKASRRVSVVRRVGELPDA